MSNNKIINNIDENKENNKSNKNEELIILPKNTEFLNRKTRWERNKEDSILKQFNIKKSHWGFESSKTFTPCMVNEIPKDININEFEMLLRKQRLEDINIWSKIKKVLKKKGIKGNDKLLYKESIGFELIDKNK